MGRQTGRASPHQKEAPRRGCSLPAFMLVGIGLLGAKAVTWLAMASGVPAMVLRLLA